MPISVLPRAFIASLGIVVGTIAILWWTIVGMALDRSPGLANRLGLTPDAIANEALIARALLHPAVIAPAGVARLRADARADPLDARPYFLLATSATAAGDKAQAVGLADAAFLRDPRFPAVLALKLQQAYAARQYGKTADYALGLLSIRPEDPNTLDFVVFLTGIPEARSRIFAALERTPDWRTGYVTRLSSKYGQTSFVYEAIQIDQSGAANLASERAKLLTDLLEKDDYERAYTAWLSWLPAEALSSVGYIYDGSFSGAPGPLPFNWQFQNSDKVTTSIDRKTGLSVNLDGTVDVVPAIQTILLPPGRYQLVTTLGAAAAAASSADTASASPFVWQVKCPKQSQLLVENTFPLARTGSTFVSAAFEVPATCAAQTIELRAKAQIYPVRTIVAIKSIAIRKAP